MGMDNGHSEAIPDAHIDEMDVGSFEPNDYVDFVGVRSWTGRERA
jgi:hypothetical protein